MRQRIERVLPVLVLLAAGCPDSPAPPASDDTTSTGDTGSTSMDPVTPADTGTTSVEMDSTSGMTSADSTDSSTTDAESSTGEPGDREPPVVESTVPRIGQMTPVRRIRVVGTVSDNVEVTELVLAVDGTETPIPFDDDGTFDAFVPLVPGANEGAIVARDEAGNEAEQPFDVYFGHRISVGNSQSAFLRDGALLTWGRNELGQLGNGTLEGSGYGDDPETSMLPVNYEIPIMGLVSVVTRQTFMIALHSDGSVWTWGSNSDGQLGYLAENDCGNGGSSPCRRDPTAVPDIAGAVAIAAGFEHSLVLLGDGTVVSFGNNQYGQLGRETMESSTEVPDAVAGLSNIVQLAAGSDCSFALTDAGEVYAWGENDRGQLGLGVADDMDHPTPTMIAGLTDVAEVTAANTTTFARLHDGTVWAWGRNHNGQAGVGDDSGDEVLVPAPVVVLNPAGMQEPLEGITNIAGDGFVGLSLSAEAEVSAWGWGFLGQLGQGYLDDGSRDLDNRLEASPVWVDPGIAALFDIVEIDVGAGGPSMALSADGDLFGWGWSFRGSLGLEGAIDAWAYSAPFVVLAADE